MIVFETSSSPLGFKLLPLPSKPIGKITTNRGTNDDLTSILIDGKVRKGMGYVFSNNALDGAYKLDLGKPQEIIALTSWSYNEDGYRGAQSITIYASNHPTDPEWALTNTSRFTKLGTISTKGREIGNFNALSLPIPKTPFRWIVWQSSPVTARGENTAFQEFAVEVSSLSR